MADGVQRAMTRQVRCAWEIYAVKELGMSAGEALRAFDNWRDSFTDLREQERVMDDRTIEQFHASRVSGNGCPDDPNGKHYFAFIDPDAEGRICIDCGAPEQANGSET